MTKHESGRSLIALSVVALASTAVILEASLPSVAMQPDVSGTLGVRIRLRIERTIPIRIATQVKDETGAIWQPYGIQLEWVDANTIDPAVSGASLDVTVERRAGRIEQTSTLGHTFVGPDTRGWRPIRVSFDVVEKVLADGTTTRVSSSGLVLDLYLARALGRVLAHEIGHALTNTPEHDRTGLMRAQFSADQLAHPDRSPFRLTCGTVDRLRDRFHIAGGAPSITQIDPAVCLR